MSEPITFRLQRSRRKGWRMPRCAVYVGRPSQWGNPFQPLPETLLAVVPAWYIVGHEYAPESEWMKLRCTGRAHSVDLFRIYARNRLRKEPKWLDPLRGKILVCWCPLDKPCHADVLIELFDHVDR